MSKTSRTALVTKALALEVARKGITVNTVSPGCLGTEMVAAMPEDILKQIIAGIPVGWLGNPAEAAALAAFMTGSKVAMNGYQHMY